MNRKAILRACVLCAFLGAGVPGPGAVLNRDAPDRRRDAVVEAVEAVMPSVVNVATASVVQYADFYDRLMREYYGWGNSVPREKLNSIGSGVIIDEDGWVLTNLHVLRRASRVEVKLWNGEVYEADPTVVATELSDVALLKLRLPPGKKLKALRFARDEDLLLGETVLALGNPFGLGGTVTRGILSSKNRRPAVEDVPLDYQDWLQTDAAINPGNSGGPLINLEGELIGLNVAVYREGQGIGFAIPVKKVAEALSQFFTPEVSSGMWFGARVRGDETGLAVSFVQSRSPAAEAGLREGQRIVDVDGRIPRTLIEFNELLCAQSEHRPTLKVREGSGLKELRVSLVPFEELLSKKLGLAIMFLGAGDQVHYPIPGRPGLYITAVERGGPGEEAGLKAGMLLAAVGDQEARDLLTVATLVSSTRPGDTLPATVVEPQRLGSGFVRYLQRGVAVRVR